MKTAILFSGQGAQYQGMGEELYHQEAIVRETFDEASHILGYEMAELCFTENERLNETEYTQPAILTVSVAFYRLLQQKGLTPDVVAGLSLGEYSALVASGALRFSEAVALVQKRGQYMTEAAPQGTGKMVAVMNAEREVIEKACQEASAFGIVAPANYNTPQQIVIGGEVAAVDQAMTLLKEAGVKRMIPLNVSGPFHTALLQPASKKLAQDLAKLKFQTMQIMSAVRFEDSIETMKAMNVGTMIEVGPGKTLTGFVKKIDKTIEMHRVEDVATLTETLTALTGR